MSITLPETKNHGWLEASRYEPGPGPIRGTGQTKYPNRPMVVGLLVDGRHARCVDHVKVAGLRQKVCIAKGADRAAVIAEARELAGAE